MQRGSGPLRTFAPKIPKASSSQPTCHSTGGDFFFPGYRLVSALTCFSYISEKDQRGGYAG
eukprot:scaffold87894_cov75-Phaeocystis_antarctica.AAC.3